MGGFDDVAGSFRFDLTDSDAAMRAAAFAEIGRLSRAHGNLSARHLAAGFQYQGKRIAFVNPQCGISKPQQMRHPLSIKTVYPRPGRTVWYDDQRDVHRQIFNGDESVDNAFMGTDPDAAARFEIFKSAAQMHHTTVPQPSEMRSGQLAVNSASGFSRKAAIRSATSSVAPRQGAISASFLRHLCGSGGVKV